MRELAILTFMTLDGVMQAPAEPAEDRSGQFSQGGWARPYWDEVMEQVRPTAMAQPYDLLLGRRTYEIFAPHWSSAPENTGPDAARLNNAKKYVASASLSSLSDLSVPAWANARLIEGDVPAAVKRLKQEDGPLIQVHGSWGLIQTLLKHDLIDEFRLWAFPVLAGAGKRLFSEGTPPRSLTLVTSGRTQNGVVMSLYRRTR